MADIIKIVKGIAYFFIGYFILIVLGYIIPPILTGLESALGNNTEFSSLAWFGVILITIIATIVLPTITITNALKENKGTNKIIEIVTGILIFIMGIAITIKSWYMIDTLTGIASNMTTQLGSNGAIFAQGVFWIGLIIGWTEIVILTPIVLITGVEIPTIGGE